MRLPRLFVYLDHAGTVENLHAMYGEQYRNPLFAYEGIRAFNAQAAMLLEWGTAQTELVSISSSRDSFKNPRELQEYYEKRGFDFRYMGVHPEFRTLDLTEAFRKNDDLKRMAEVALHVAHFRPEAYIIFDDSNSFPGHPFVKLDSDLGIEPENVREGFLQHGLRQLGSSQLKPDGIAARKGAAKPRPRRPPPPAA